MGSIRNEVHQVTLKFLYAFDIFCFSLKIEQKDDVFLGKRAYYAERLSVGGLKPRTIKHGIVVVRAVLQAFSRMK